MLTESFQNEQNRHVELYWDVGSTNTYFAIKLIKPILARTGAELVLHPFNLGYVFRKHKYVLADEPQAKITNRKRDLQRWAEKYSLPFRFPDTFPIKTSRTLRGAIAMRTWNLEVSYTEAVLNAYWEGNNASVSEYSGLRPIVAALGVDAIAFETLAESLAVRSLLIEITNKGLERGVFGAPTFVVNGELFWGKDRLEFVEDELRRS